MRILLAGIIYCAAGLWFTADGAAAQEPAEAAPGDRVRVRAPALRKPVIGSFERACNDTVFVRTAETEPPSAVSLRGTVEVEVSRGSRSGALQGALAGALAGGFIGLATSECEIGSELCSLDRAAVTFAGAMGGALAGLLLGSISSTEVWEEVTVDGSAPCNDTGG
jgi:hypothetical protein